MRVSSFLIGEKNNYNFSSKLLGKRRLRDYDKDGVPDIFDCQWRNPKKDSTVEPSTTSGITYEQQQQNYEQQLAKYNEYAAQKQAYDQEQGDINLAFKLWTKYLNGKDPYLYEKSANVKKWFNYYKNRYDAMQYQKFLESKPSSPQLTFYDELGQPVSIDPTQVEGGIDKVLERYKPTPPQQKPEPEKPTFEEIIQPPVTPLTPYLEPKTTYKETPIYQKTISGLTKPVEVKKPSTSEQVAREAWNTYLSNLPKEQTTSPVFNFVQSTTTQPPKRETISTQPTVTFFTTEQMSKPKPSLTEFGYSVITAPRDYVSGLPSKKTEQDLFSYQPVTPTIPRKETVSYAPPVLSPEGKIEKERILTETIETFKIGVQAETGTQKIQEKYQGILNKDLEKINQKYQDKINKDLGLDKGNTVTYDEARIRYKELGYSDKEINDIFKKSEEEYKKAYSKYDKEINKEYESLTGKYTKEAQGEVDLLTGGLIKGYELGMTGREKSRETTLKKETGFLTPSFYERRAGDVLGAGLYAVPVYGQLLIGADVYKLATTPPEKTIKETLTVEGASTLLTYGLVGGGIAKGKGLYKESKISEALGKASIETKSRGVSLIDGKEANIFEVSLKPEKGMEKYTPEVKGTFIEYGEMKDSKGVSTTFGQLESSYKGKTTKTDILSGTQSILKDNLVKSYTESVSRGKQSIYTRLFSESRPSKTKVIKDITGNEVQVTMIDTITGVISKEKVKPKTETFGKYEALSFEEMKRSGKEYKESKSIQVSKELIKDEESIGRLSSGYGLSRAKEVTKEPRPFSFTKEGKNKPFEFLEKEEPKGKFEQAKKPEPFKTEFKEPKEVTPSYVGGKGGVLSESKFASKSYLIPETYETGQFIKGLSKGYAKPSYAKGILGISGGLSTGTQGISPTSFDLNLTGTFNGTGTGLLSSGISRPQEKVKDYTKDITKTGTGRLDLFSNKNIDKLDSGLIQKPTNSFKTVNNFRIDLGTGQGQDQTTKQRFDFKRDFGKTTDFDFNFKITYPENIRPKLPEPERDKFKRQQGYDAYIYIESTKKPYWQKVNEKPLTKESAVSVMAEQVDNSISAKGKVVKTKPKFVKGKEVKQEVSEIKNNYYSNNSYKFRQFKQTKGKKERIPNQLIELQKYRLDKPTETISISKSRKSMRSLFGL